MSKNISTVYGNDKYNCSFCTEKLAIIYAENIEVEFIGEKKLYKQLFLCRECAIEDFNLSECPSCYKWFSFKEEKIDTTPYFQQYFDGDKFTELLCSDCDEKYEQNYFKSDEQLYDENEPEDKEKRSDYYKNCL